MKIELGQLDPDAVKIVQRLRRFDHQAYLVGGCVRDLLLGYKPKDFDVSTSATPQELRRMFRNCRIIGRRFRLAHIFFGSKIIETATFRTNPREGEEDERESRDTSTGETAAVGSGGTENSDLLIRRDNVFGTAEEDARRRDFTINGLFLDIETGEVIDYVDGSRDIENRVVRTIGNPDIRFREDPIRILRAVKFAARCNLTIEPETHTRMMEHAGEIAKCAQARVSEEFFRLLRSGAAFKSMELLLKLRLLGTLTGSLEKWLAGAAPAATLEPTDSTPPALADAETTPAGADAPASGTDASPDAVTDLAAAGDKQRDRFWAYLRAMDSTIEQRGTPTNAVVLACILTPMLRDALDPDNRTVRDVGHHVTATIRPLLDELGVSRRDSEQARQLLLVVRYVLPSASASKSGTRRRRPRINSRDLQNDLAWMIQVIATAESIPLTEFPEVETRASTPAQLGPAVATARPTAKPVGMTPIPVVPRGLTALTQRPAFLGVGTFGSLLGKSWSGVLD